MTEVTKMKFKMLPISLFLIFAIVLAACGSPAAKPATSSTPSATSTPAVSSTPAASSAPTSTGDRLAYFAVGSGNQYMTESFAYAKKKAAELGVPLDTFDGRWDALTQYNQIQNAINSGKYKGFLVAPIDGNQLCNTLTKQAPDKGITVAVMNATACGVPGYHDGTLTFIGGQSLDVYKNVVNKMLSDNPNGGTLAAIGGPDTGSNYLNMKAALESELPKYPKWKLVGMYATDYTSNKGYQVAQNVLQANPNLDIIFTNYSDLSLGVVKAKDAAKRDKVQVYDMGGNKWAFDAVKQGTIKMTVVMLVDQEVGSGLQALVDHFNGKTVPKEIDLTKDPILPGTPYVYKENIDQFTAKGFPQY
jgi:ribose transport system substrate-binding protein